MKRKSWFFDLFLTLFVFIIICISVLSFKRINDLINSSVWVNKSNTLVFKLERLFSVIKDAETGQRGFLLSKDSSFLQPYYQALPVIPKLIHELDSLTGNNSGQNKKLKKLGETITARVNHLKDLLYQPPQDSTIISAMKKGKGMMDQIQAEMKDIEHYEQDLLNEHVAVHDNYTSITPAFSLALIVFTLCIVFISFFKIRKDKADISKKNEELVAIKTYLQAILDSSSDIILTFDENLNYTSINNAGEKYLNRSRSELLGKNPFDLYPETRNTERHHLMLKALKGETSHIESLGTSADPQMKIHTTFVPLVVEGKIRGILNIAKDITSLEKANETVRKTNELLELKNLELEEANNGLLSFNYIASHDLKEPLRKIQTFARLLTELEKEKLSAESKYYFERIINSAARMQTLIEALLDFSKTQFNATNFEPTDMNLILDDLRKEFREPLALKNGILEHEILPTINAIPALISQLFSNLISNSIKYSKKEEPPRITICCEKVNKIKIQGRIIHKDYWKFSVTDNGIGFNQQYADKIFELFQRLHGNSKNYEGTGIGLTICKKIVQNHKGLIYAESELGKGSTFFILIPVNP